MTICGSPLEYFGQKILSDITFQLQPNERILMIGPNGAGKSTLIRVLAGFHISFDNDKMDIMGTDRPNDQRNGLAHMGNRWIKDAGSFAGSTPFTADIAAGEMMADWQEANLERRNELVEVLE